jgi:hypothetical protein
MTSTTLYTGYGGARGGGKSHSVRIHAINVALTYAGIKILIVRRTYGDLEENHIMPILNIVVPKELATYKGDTHTLTFINGSTIKFGHYQGTASNTEYQGKEYDYIFIDEATQFCVHPRTELLLERGWTNVTEARRGDRVLSLNPDGTQEYKEIENMFAFPYDGELLECNQRNGISFCVTPDHKIPVASQREAGGWYFKTAEHLKHDRIYRAGVPQDKPDVEWYTGLQHHHKGHNEADRIIMDDWLDFWVGIYLRDALSNGKTGERLASV